MVDSLQLSGDGKNVALAFTLPTEVFDVLEALAKGRSSTEWLTHSVLSAIARIVRPRGLDGLALVASRMYHPRVAEHVFFYGTLMTPFNRPGRQRVTPS